MSSVEIYTTMFCPYCSRAKSLLKSKGVHFKEIDVTSDLNGRKEMSRLSGGATSVPQIFINGQHIGDCDYIHKLDAAGKLDPLLQP
ncbi:glutaredoxin 3 [Sneathiella glossodoripedis]|uniref:glutaredoxin 3 n=1 Tax=Sneathiella glossodoripedis TaxID=418853 RepID=UPI000472CF9F|nr:glutaredoxin 3 [Sneathiella glossodoripedis]